MKYKIFFFISFCFCACSVERKTSFVEQELFDKIYTSQKLCYDSSTKNKSDFVSLINFSKNGRFKLYKQNLVSLSQFDTCTILEGFANGWTRYIGLFICNDRIFLYKNKPNSHWECSWINLKDNKLESSTEVNKEVFMRIKDWDIAYINSLKGKLGSYIHDGYSFMATRIIDIKSGRPTIESISFYEFR